LLAGGRGNAAHDGFCLPVRRPARLALAILRLAGGLTGRVAFLYIENRARQLPALTLLFLIYFGLAPVWHRAEFVRLPRLSRSA